MITSPPATPARSPFAWCVTGEGRIVLYGKEAEARVLPWVRSIWLIPGLWVGLYNLSFPICRMDVGAVSQTSDFAMCFVTLEFYFLNAFFLHQLHF